jgi:hypothetical protein
MPGINIGAVDFLQENRSGVDSFQAGLQPFDEVAENVADGRPEQGEDDDDHDSDEYEDQRVLNQTLTFFFGSE